MSTKDSLAGMRVLVTRPEAQAGPLVTAITNAGGVAVLAPMMRIVPIEDPQSQLRIRSRIQRLDQYDRAIFISSNAARLGADWIDRYWPQLPGGLTLVAIGPATARELNDLGAEVIIAPGGMRSEDLLAIPVLSDVAGKRILLIRGRGGRELLADTLQKRGATVDYLELYERQFVSYASEQLAALLRDEAVNAITVTSGEVLSALQAALGSNTDPWGLIPLLAPSARVQTAAREAGFINAIDVQGADESAMLKGLLGLAAGREYQH